MKTALSSFKISFKMITGNAGNFIFALIPILIGLATYYFIGMELYQYVMGEGQALIERQFGASANEWSSFIYYALAIFFTIILYFFVNWTFVIFISIVASPFNDILSSRIEKMLTGQEMESVSESFSRMIKKVLWTVFNEIKKVLFIGFIAFIGLVLSYIPILTPLSLLISALLLAAQFIDYSWARNDLSLGKCISDLRNHLMSYTLMGVFFFFLVSIPFVNLIVPSLATSYFTTLWVRFNKDVKLEDRSQTT
jgi:CysZ protein